MISSISAAGGYGTAGSGGAAPASVNAGELARARQAADVAEARARDLRREATQAQRDAETQRSTSDALEEKIGYDPGREYRSYATQLLAYGYGQRPATGGLLHKTA